ncbi:hypothetical protein BGZ60DRAFT_398743 [Tricladium varicosporioides]|nr:hypothetical protein BGZ60DRAFT_398743 [Hymenoscyphus varicosporioides]
MYVTRIVRRQYPRTSRFTAISCTATSLIKLPVPYTQTLRYSTRSQERTKEQSQGGETTKLPPVQKTGQLKRNAFVFVFCAVLGAAAAKLGPEWLNSDQRIFNPPRFTPFTIVSREDISSTSFILTLQPESPNVANTPDPFKDQWQKGTWSVEVKQPQLQISRAYTPLPTVEQANTLGIIRVLVRKEYKGEVSSYLHQLPVGGRVELRGPNTEFVLPDEVTDVIFLAGGTGIAPALQVAHSLLDRRSHQPPPNIRIVWANRRREDCKSPAEQIHQSPTTLNDVKLESGNIVSRIDELKRKFPDNFNVEYYVDEEGTYLDQKRISQMTKSRPSIRMEPVATRIDTRLIFVCGPEGFINFLAGPKKWEGGKEAQGQLGGIIGRMGLRDWKVWKL